MNEKPAPPYYAVIFTSIRTGDEDGYDATARHMAELAAGQPGYLGFETVSDGDRGISISYWKDMDSITAWKQVADHVSAQKMGRGKWYKSYRTRIARVERDYSFEKPEN